MQQHLPHPQAHWQEWARGLAIVFGLIAAPVVVALIWLAMVRGILF
jgi:hypothetical protein